MVSTFPHMLAAHEATRHLRPQISEGNVSGDNVYPGILSVIDYGRNGHLFTEDPWPTLPEISLPAILHEMCFNLKDFWQRSLIHSMIFTSNISKNV